MVHDNKPRKEFSVLKDRAVIQKDLKKRKELVNGNITMLSKDKCEVLLLGLNNSMQQCRLGTSLLGSSSAEDGLDIQILFRDSQSTRDGQIPSKNKEKNKITERFV